MKTILAIFLFCAFTANSQTVFTNSIIVYGGVVAKPQDAYSSAIVARVPNNSVAYVIYATSASTNLFTLDASGYLRVTGGANLGGNLMASGVLNVGDRSTSLVGWPGILTATNATSPGAYAALSAKEFWAGPSQGLTTNINVVTDTGTNQLQFTGGILTGVVRQ